MVLAGLLGALLTLAILRSADETTAVAVAARDLTVGETLGAEDLEWIEVGGDPRAHGALVGRDDVDAAVGSVVRNPVPHGALVPRASFEPVGSGDVPRAMSFPIDRARAVAGAVATGDRVDVVVADRDGAASFVATDVAVLAVDDGGSGPLGASGDITVTLAVDGPGALGLAAALETGSVTLVRATGTRPLPPAEPPRAP